VVGDGFSVIVPFVVTPIVGVSELSTEGEMVPLGSGVMVCGSKGVRLGRGVRVSVGARVSVGGRTKPANSWGTMQEREIKIARNNKALKPGRFNQAP
jgi:hypothetical protein